MSDLPIDVDAEAIFLDGRWYTREELSRRIKTMLDGGDFNVARPSAALEQLTHSLTQVRTLVFRCPPDLAEGINELAARQGYTVGGVIREAVTQHLADQALAPVVEASRASGFAGGYAGSSPSAHALASALLGAPVRAGGSNGSLQPHPTPSQFPPAPPPFRSSPSAAVLAAAAVQQPPGVISTAVSVPIDLDDEPQRQEPTIRRMTPQPPTGTTQDDLPKVIVEEQPMVIAGPGALANAGVNRPIELTQKKNGE